MIAAAFQVDTLPLYQQARLLRARPYTGKDRAVEVLSRTFFPDCVETVCESVWKESISVASIPDKAAPMVDWSVEKELKELHSASGADDISATLKQLASIPDPVVRQLARDAAIRKLNEIGYKAPAKIVDAAFSPSTAGTETTQGQAVLFADVQPAADPVEGCVVLDDVVNCIQKYVILSAESALAIALWIIFTYTHEQAWISPILGIISAQKRCGKSTLLNLVSFLVNRPLLASNVSSSALFRSVEEYHPTLLIDEADSFLRENEELRGILNSGHTRRGALIIRTCGDDHEPRTFSTWCPKAIALIGRLPGTLEDRAILVNLRRKAPQESVKKMRLLVIEAELAPLKSRIVRWVRDNVETFKAAIPKIPDGLHDRAADNWTPLLAIADAIGGDWPVQARHAAITLCATQEDDGHGVRLLRDLKTIFDDCGKDSLFTATICDALAAQVDSPWPTIRNGHPITAHVISRMLKPFGITPTTVRDGADVAKGYRLQDLQDTFIRYLPSTETLQRYNTDEHSAKPQFQSVTEKEGVTDAKVNSVKPVAECNVVTDEKRDTAGTGGDAEATFKDWFDERDSQ